MGKRNPYNLLRAKGTASIWHEKYDNAHSKMMEDIRSEMGACYFTKLFLHPRTDLSSRRIGLSRSSIFSPFYPRLLFFFYPVTFFQLWFKSIRAINIAINKIFLIKKFFFFFTHVLNLQIQAPKTLHPLSWIIIQCIVSSSRSNSYNIILFENNIP